MKAADIMTRKVKTVAPDTPVEEVAELMVAHRISGVPVADSANRVVGIVTEGDLLRRGEIGTERRRSWWLELLTDPGTSAAEFIKTRGRKAADVMTRSVISVTPRTGLREIADTMEKWNIKRVPVVSNGKLAGIVSRHDLLRALRGAKAKTAAKPRGDAAIREYLKRATDNEAWAGSATVNFVVEHGTVELFGAVYSKEQGEALRVLAENAPGVRAVKSRLAVLPTYAQAT
jgi:CBS domain-containing protein